MNRTPYPVTLPASAKEAAERPARQDGVSPDLWIASAVAQKIGAVETAATFFRSRAGQAHPEDLLPFLMPAPDLAPEPRDEVQSSA